MTFIHLTFPTVDSAKLTVDNSHYPADGYSPDFDGIRKTRTQITPLLQEMADTLGWGSNGMTCGISSDEFISDYTIFCFNTSNIPISANYNSYDNITAISSVHFRFSEPTPENVNLYCMLITPGRVSYRKDSTFALDYCTSLP